MQNGVCIVLIVTVVSYVLLNDRWTIQMVQFTTTLNRKAKEETGGKEG